MEVRQNAAGDQLAEVEELLSCRNRMERGMQKGMETSLIMEKEQSCGSEEKTRRTGRRG